MTSAGLSAVGSQTRVLSRAEACARTSSTGTDTKITAHQRRGRYAKRVDLEDSHVKVLRPTTT
jgi:hypothetical protein